MLKRTWDACRKSGEVHAVHRSSALCSGTVTNDIPRCMLGASSRPSMVKCHPDGNRAVNNGLEQIPSLSCCPNFEEAREHGASKTAPTLMSLCYCSTSVLVRALSMPASAPLSTPKGIQHTAHTVLVETGSTNQFPRLRFGAGIAGKTHRRSIFPHPVEFVKRLLMTL